MVRACADLGVPIVPQGGNTGQCGGATPDDSGNAIVLSLSRMNRVRAVDSANATLTVEAGVPLAAVQQAAADHGLMFPLSLAAEGSCSIGGNVSTNAGGHAVLRFGNTRELVLGIEVVLADGRIWDGLRGLRKDNTGYDLKQLFIGAEGTLGIVTAAVLKLYPAPRTRATALAALPDVATAIRLLADLRQALGDRITGFELMSAYSLALSRKHHPTLPDPCPGSPWYVLLQVDDNAVDSPAAGAAGTRAERGARIRPRAGRDDRAVGRAGARAVGAAGEHRRSAAPRRSQHQARHLACRSPSSPAFSTRRGRRWRRRCRAFAS